MSEHKQNVEALFEGALGLAGREQRAAFLERQCGGDASLRKEVEGLLRAAERAGGFLAAETRGDAATPLHKPGDRIGGYKLLQQIGEGGCGVVFMAEQVQPVRRQVALKIIKPGMDTKQVIARFEAERQALALMEHPNIARVLDAGATDTGWPYFVMELVRGLKITDFCNQHQLSTEARLQLFVKVCQAVQHAHLKGIIHRDLKPSNILVTVNDGLPQPKVIDFGIAKATTGQPLTDKTVFTAFSQFLGTPAYMSPEQAVMTSQDVDTRTDVYSLGVLLYELLTGRPPFEQKELLAAGLDELRRTIREVEPVKPSTRLTQELAASDMSPLQPKSKDGEARADLRRLLQEVRGDLDWIVMKCLEKDRTHRYETTNALAEDIRRHLDREPVLARRPSALYRLQKSVQRNRLAYASAAIVLTALMVGLCVATWGLLREREARLQADAARQQAEAARSLATAEAARNEQVAKFFTGSLAGKDLWRGQDPVFAHRFLDRISVGVQLMLSDQPALQGDVRVGLGNSYAAIDDFPKAVTNLQLAIQAYQTAFGTQHVRLAGAVAQLGRVCRLAQNDAAARSNAQWSVAIARGCNDPETLADCLLNAAKSFTSAESPPPDAIPFLREAMEMRRHTVPHLLALLDSTRLLVKAIEGLIAVGREDEAKAILEEELRKSPEDGDLRKLQQTLSP